MNIYNTTFQPGEKPVVLYFTAPWCVPCKRFGPIMETVSKEHPELEFIKIDADEFFQVTSHYDVMSLPSVLYLKEGVESDRMIGLHTKFDVETWLENLL